MGSIPSLTSSRSLGSVGLPLEEGILKDYNVLGEKWSNSSCCYGSDVVGDDRARSQVGALACYFSVPVNEPLWTYRYHRSAGRRGNP